MIRHAEDVAAGRRTGKALGMRAISGDLTGYHRLKVDESGHKPERWRLVYELRPSPKQVAMIVIVVGPRSDIYKGLSKRLGTRIENAEKDAY